MTSQSVVGKTIKAIRQRKGPFFKDDEQYLEAIEFTDGSEVRLVAIRHESADCVISARYVPPVKRGKRSDVTQATTQKPLT